MRHKKLLRLTLALITLSVALGFLCETAAVACATIGVATIGVATIGVATIGVATVGVAILGVAILGALRIDKRRQASKQFEGQGHLTLAKT